MSEILKPFTRITEEEHGINTTPITQAYNEVLTPEAVRQLEGFRGFLNHLIKNGIAADPQVTLIPFEEALAYVKRTERKRPQVSVDDICVGTKK